LLNLAQLWRKILLSLVFGALVFVLLSFYANFSDLRQALTQFPVLYLPLLFALAFCNYIVRFFKWDYYLSLLHIKITKGQSFTIFLAGLIMSISPGKFGEVLKSFLIKSVNNTPISRSAPVVVAERLTDLIGLLVLIMLGLSSSRASLIVFFISSVLVVTFLGMISSARVSRGILDLIERLINSFLGDENKQISQQAEPLLFKDKVKKLLITFPRKMNVAYESIACLVTFKPLCIATALSVLSWAFEGFAFVLLLRGFGYDLGLTTGFFIYSFSIIVGALTMLPGGVGLTETSLSALLILKGVTKPVSVAVTLIIRLTTLWFAVAIGAGVLALFLKKYSPQAATVAEDAS